MNYFQTKAKHIAIKNEKAAKHAMQLGIGLTILGMAVVMVAAAAAAAEVAGEGLAVVAGTRRCRNFLRLPNLQNTCTRCVYMYISTDLCGYMYMCVYTHVFIHIYIYIYTFINVHMYIHMCMCVYMCIYIYIYTNAYIRNPVDVQLHVCVYIYIYTHLYMHTAVHAHVYTHKHLYMYTACCLGSFLPVSLYHCMVSFLHISQLCSIRSV